MSIKGTSLSIIIGKSGAFGKVLDCGSRGPPFKSRDRNELFCCYMALNWYLFFIYQTQKVRHLWSCREKNTCSLMRPSFYIKKNSFEINKHMLNTTLKTCSSTTNCKSTQTNQRKCHFRKKSINNANYSQNKISDNEFIRNSQQID